MNPTNSHSKSGEGGEDQSEAEFSEQKEIVSITASISEQFVRQLVQQIDAIFWTGNPQTLCFNFVSQQAAAILGYPVEQWLTEPHFWINLIHSEQRQQILTFCLDMLKQGRNHDFEYSVVAADGRLVWLHNIVYVVCDQQGRAEQFGGLMLDVTKRKQLELELQQQAERERLVRVITQQIRQSLSIDQILTTTVTEVRQCLQADRVVVYRYESHGKSVVVAESVASGWNEIIGITVYESWFVQSTSSYWLTKPLAISEIQQQELPEQARELVEQQQVKAVLAAPIFLEDQLIGVLAVHQCSKSRQWQLFEIDLLEQLATQLAIAIQQSKLYQRLEQANQELQLLVTKDSLTKIANRRYFDQYLNQEWRRLAREQFPLSLILCDIDFFKLYNDSYGHQAGDECLQEVATAIVQVVQRPADLVVRYGGEEFAVILPNTAIAGAAQVAEQIRSAVKALVLPLGSPQHLTLSVGVASAVPKIEVTAATLFAAADQALYQAKQQGRDRVVLDLTFC